MSATLPAAAHPQETPAMPAAETSVVTNITDALARAETWLDNHGKWAWGLAILAGFLSFWPLGLALLIWVAGGRSLVRGRGEATSPSQAPAPAPAPAEQNTAFEAYKEQTIDRLSHEQDHFDAFVDQLRANHDADDFDAFLDARARKAQPGRAAGTD